MKKLWIRWAVMMVLVTALAGLFIRLGEWQLHRLEWRRETNARVQAYEKSPVLPYDRVFQPGRTIGDDDQWQRVTVTGTFDATHEVQAMYRTRATGQNGSDKGSEAITPLHTTDGKWLLVDRGFLVRADGAPEQAVLPAPPKGTVTVVGYVRRSEQGKDSATTVSNGLVQLVNAPKIAAATGLPLLDGYVGLTQVTPAQDASLLPMQLPELTEGPHLSYALQWFCFTAIAVAGVVILIRTDLKDREKAKRRAERKAAREAAATGDALADEPVEAEAPKPQSAEDRRRAAYEAALKAPRPVDLMRDEAKKNRGH